MTTSAIVLRKREKIIKVQWREIVNNFKEFNQVENTSSFL